MDWQGLRGVRLGMVGRGGEGKVGLGVKGLLEGEGGRKPVRVRVGSVNTTLIQEDRS